MAAETLPVRPMDAAHLRALAHPLRLQLLQILGAEGPATASLLARRLGESSGATSYHLRALHRAGMVEEAEQRNARERWWQRSPDRWAIPNSVPEDASAAERAELQAAHSQIESIRMWGTAAEIQAFVQAVIELAEPLRKAPAGDSERLEVHFTFRVLPQE